MKIRKFLIFLFLLLTILKGEDKVFINVKDFSNFVKNGDWSEAIQKAIDYVNKENGYEYGATVFFPPGIYKIDKTIFVGKIKSHYGLHLLGYGAVLLGTEELDKQDLKYEERSKKLSGDYLNALPGELDFEGKNVGVPIIELCNPPEIEGASFVIEGLTFDREKKKNGVGIKIPAEEVPKNTTFRSIQVYNQNVGIHINYCWQIRFESCIIRGNNIGIWGRNHFNSISIINTTIRRNHTHGLIIGPNYGSWGSSGIYIAGCIFESNKGYGILNLGGVQVSIVGNYFEANGNQIGVFTPFGNTTIDTNHFWGSYGHGWKINPYSDKSHIVIGGTKNVQLRNNRYGGGELKPILIVGNISGDKNRFDSFPEIVDELKDKIKDGLEIVDDSGLYVYIFSSGKFEKKKIVIEGGKN